MDISLYGMIIAEYQDVTSVNTVDMMNAISHQIEDAVIKHELAVDFWAGFQRFSYFGAQKPRYQQLGKVARRVHIFGVADVEPPPIAGIEYRAIDAQTALAGEWFLVINTPTFWTALLTRELEGRDSHGKRRFQGMWTYDETVVDRAYLLLCQSTNMPYRPVKHRNYQRQGEILADISSHLITQLDTTTGLANRRWKQVCTLQQIAQRVATTTPEGLLNEVVRVLHTTLGAQGAAVVGMDASNAPTLLAQAGYVGNPSMGTQAAPSALARVVAQNTPIVIHDIPAMEPESVFPLGRSLVAVPIQGRDGVMGVLAISAKEECQWSDDDARTLAGVAALVSNTLQATDAMLTSANERVKKMERGLGLLRKQVQQLGGTLAKVPTTGSYSVGQQTVLNQALEQHDVMTAALGLPATMPRITHNGDAPTRASDLLDSPPKKPTRLGLLPLSEWG